MHRAKWQHRDTRPSQRQDRRIVPSEAGSASSAAPARDDATLEFASETKPAEVPPRLPVVIKVRKPTMVALGLTLGVLVVAGAVLAGADTSGSRRTDGLPEY